jgi:hypothetical protein
MDFYTIASIVLGITNFVLVLFQLMSGLKVIKVKYKTHKFFGILLFITASIHGGYLIYTNYF